MSSTTNVQNLLVNVFRPVYVYDSIANLFQVKLDMSNVNTVFANIFSGLRADIGDAAGNVYVGVGSGNPIDVSNDCANNTVLGLFAGAGMSNVTNSIYLGYTAGQGSENADGTTAIGINTIGDGISNIYIGNSTGGAGDSNLFLGHDLSANASLSNTMYLGFGNPLITGKFDTQRVGILTTTPTYPIELANYTYISNGLGINADPVLHTLNVNGDVFVEDGFGSFTFDQNQTTSNSILTATSYTPGKILEATFGSVTNDASMNVYGTVNATNGYSSATGVTGSLANGATSNIGVWKKGSTIVSVVGATAGAWSSSMWVYDGTTATTVSSNQTAITITTSTSNIVLSNTSAGTTTFRYNITYLPTP
jgi:hypothetical protein